jgi:hypothetical protein
MRQRGSLPFSRLPFSAFIPSRFPHHLPMGFEGSCRDSVPSIGLLRSADLRFCPHSDLEFLAQFCPLLRCVATDQSRKRSRRMDSWVVEMKRVLFLALLITSVVEFTMERNRTFLLFAAVVALIYGLFHPSHPIHAASGADRSAEKVERSG